MNSAFYVSLLLVGFAFGGGFAGCSTEMTTSHLTLEPPTDSSAVAVRAPVSASIAPGTLCVAWRPTQDCRPDKTSLARFPSQTYVADDVLPWVDHALHAANDARFATVENPIQADVVVTPRLRMLYLEFLDVTKCAVVVIEVEFSYRGQPTITKTYRGQYAGLNWAGSDAEMERALRSALATCVDKIMADLNSPAWIKAI
jgi:hypothetical protein